MVAITEDYVSFETATLLKEKGMNKSCFKHYVQKNNDDGTSEAVTVCTLQMAMKWLREVHHIFLSIQQHMDMSYVWYAYMDGFANGCDRKSHNNTYEEACEAAILYCLKHLI